MDLTVKAAMEAHKREDAPYRLIMAPLRTERRAHKSVHLPSIGARAKNHETCQPTQRGREREREGEGGREEKEIPLVPRLRVESLWLDPVASALVPVLHYREKSIPHHTHIHKKN